MGIWQGSGVVGRGVVHSTGHTASVFLPAPWDGNACRRIIEEER